MISDETLDEWLNAATANAIIDGAGFEIAPKKFHDCGRDCRFIVKSSPTGIFYHEASRRMILLIDEIRTLQRRIDRLDKIL